MGFCVLKFKDKDRPPRQVKACYQKIMFSTRTWLLRNPKSKNLLKLFKGFKYFIMFKSFGQLRPSIFYSFSYWMIWLTS